MTDLLNPSVAPDYGAAPNEEWDVLTSPTETGPGQRRTVRTAPRWMVSEGWLCDPVRAALLGAFFRAQKGPLISFYFYTPDPFWSWANVPAGTGTGSQLIFPIPGYLVSKVQYPPVVTVAGAAKVQGIDFEVGVENRGPYSEDLSQTGTWAVVSGSTVTRTSGQTDPLGGTTAWRIQTSGGAVVSKLLWTTGGTPAVGLLCITDLWVKNPGAKAVTVNDGLGGSQVIAAGAGWTHVTLQTASPGATLHQPHFDAPTSGDSLDFQVWHPWIAWSNAFAYYPMSNWGYIPTVAAAIPADTTLGKENLVFYSGHAPGAAAAILISFTGKRLLLGSLLATPSWNLIDYMQSTCAVKLSGEEV